MCFNSENMLFDCLIQPHQVIHEKQEFEKVRDIEAKFTKALSISSWALSISTSSDT